MVQNTVQPTYSRYHITTGAPGTWATMTGHDSDTFLAEAVIPFGVAVSKGVGERGAIKGGNTFMGISIRDITLVHTTTDQYEIGDNVGVSVRGDIWVRCEAAVVARTAVKYNATTGQLGSAAGVTIAGATWMTAGTLGGMAVVRLNNSIGDLTT